MIDRDQSEAAVPRRPVKSETAFRTISEVSDELEVPQHVLRFWESKFSQIKPLKRGGGRRYYRPEDLQLLKHIRDLLYKDGYTIKGVQKLLRDESKGAASKKTEEEDAGADLLPAPNASLEEPVMEPADLPEVGQAIDLPQAVTSPAASEEASDIRRESLQAILEELLVLQSMLRKARGA